MYLAKTCPEICQQSQTPETYQDSLKTLKTHSTLPLLHFLHKISCILVFFFNFYLQSFFFLVELSFSKSLCFAKPQTDRVFAESEAHHFARDHVYHPLFVGAF